MKKRMLDFIALVLVLSFTSTVFAETVEIPLSNASFEVSRFAEMGLTDNMWWFYGPSAVFEPSGSFMSSNYPGQSIPDGLLLVQVGAYGIGGFVGQPLPITLQPNTIYSFTVNVGSRATDPFDPDPDWGNFFGMRLKIDDGSTWGGTTIKKVWTGTCYPEGYYSDVPAVTGQFVPMTLTVDSSTITDPNLFGKPLLLGIEAGEIVMDFDKITATMSNANLTGVPVTINATPAGINTVNILGTHTYAVGTSLFLRADWFVDCPEVYKFDHWTVNGSFFSNQQEIVIDIDAAKTVTAVYVTGTACTTISNDIPVVNGNFESPKPGDTGWDTIEQAWPDIIFGRNATGWTQYNLWNLTWAQGRILYTTPTLAGWEHYFPAISQTPYGNQVAWLWGGCGFEQILGANLQAGTTYTLNFDLGWGADQWAGDTGWMYVEFLAGDQQVLKAGIDMSNNVVGASYGMITVPHDSWAHETLTYTTSSSTLGIGQPLKIRFYGDNSHMVDNVSLNASSTAAPVVLTISTSSNGVVTPVTVTPTVGQHIYSYGSKVNVTADRYLVCPSVYEFDHWVGDVNDTASASTFVRMDSDITVTGVFADSSTCGDECHPINRFDSDGDCDVDMHDFANFAGAWDESYGIPFTIVNGGFESPAWNGGGGAQDPAWVDAGSGGAGIEFGTYAAGWTPFSQFGSVGSRIVYSTPAAWDWNYYPGVNQTPYGSQVANLWLGCGYRQTVATLQANTTYILSYDVGIGKDRPSNDAAWFRVEFNVEDGGSGTKLMNVGKGLGAGDVFGAEYGQVACVYNDWVHQTVSFTTSSDSAFLGNNVYINFFGDGSVRLDNFTLKTCSSTTNQFDSDSDCDVDLIDLAAFAQVWLNCTSPSCLD